MSSSSDRRNASPPPEPMAAVYSVGKYSEPVTIVAILPTGAAMIAHQDGRLSVVENHRLRLRRDPVVNEHLEHVEAVLHEETWA